MFVVDADKVVVVVVNVVVDLRFDKVEFKMAPLANTEWCSLRCT